MSRTERSPTVSAARERCATGALELDIAPTPVATDHFAEQNGPPVPQLVHEATKLVTGIREGDRFCAIGHDVAGQNLGARR